MAHHKKASIKSKASSPEKSHVLYILIVEDEPTHVALMRHTIQSANVNVRLKFVSSLQEYRIALKKSLPDIVLIDLHLPDGKAFEVLTSPLEAGSFPIVVITSSGDEKIAVKAMKAGALDYIIKSTEAFQAIPQTIERALREWKLIQERKRTEEALRESEVRFRSLYDNVAIGLYRTTPAGKILMANRALVKMLGYSTFEELAERNLAKVGFTQSSQRKVFLRNIEMEGEINDFESAWTRQDGSLVIVKESARAIRGSQGKTLYYDGAVEDITERRLAEVASRHAEAALRESEEKFRSIAENFHDVLFITDTKGSITYISPAVDRIFGYKSENMKGRFFGEYLDETELPRVVSVFENAIRMGIPTKNLTVLAKRRDGNTFYAEIDTSIIIKDGKVQGTSGVIRDITERKRTEEALTASESRFRKVYSEGSVPMAFLNQQFQFTQVNKPFEMMVGYSEIELQYMTFREVTHPESIQRDLANIQKLLRGELEIYTTEKKYLAKDQEIRWGFVNVSILKDANGAFLSFVVIIIDITERKRAEEALRESEDKFKYVFDYSPVGKSITLPSGEISVNKAFCDLLGYTQEELRQKRWQDITHPDDIDLTQRAIDSLLSGKQESSRFVKRFLHKDGAAVWVDLSTFLRCDMDDKPLYFITTVVDITERKRAEEALRESEERFSSLSEAAFEGIVLSDNGRIVDANEQMAAMFGYTRTEMIKLSVENFVAPESLELVLQHIRSGSEDPYEHFSLRKDGSIFPVEIRAKSIPYKGRIVRVTAVRDITERKRIDEELIQSKTLLSETEKTGKIGGWEFNVKTMVQTWTEETFNILEIDLTKGAPKVPEGIDFIAPAFRPMAAQAIQKAIECGEPYDQEWEVITAKGNKRWVHSVARVHQEHGKTISISGSFQDITERKLIEEELSMTKNVLVQSFDQSPTPMVLVSMPDAIFQIVNPACREFLGMMDEPSYIGTSLINFEPSFKDYDALGNIGYVKDLPLARALAGQKTSNEERRIVRKDGTTRWALVNGTPICNNKGEIIAGFLSMNDITERKQAEQALQKSRDLLFNLACLVPGVVYQYRLYPDGRSAFPYSSPGMNDIYEVTPEEVQEDATPVFGRLHPDDYDRVSRSIQESASTLQTFYCEFRVILPRQGLRWRWSQAQPERMADGGTMWHGIISDITERKRAEDVLLENEQRLRTIVDAAPFGAHIYELQSDARLVLVGANLSADKILHIEHQPLLGKTIEEAFPSLAKTEIPSAYRKVAASGENFEMDQVDYEDAHIRGAFEIHAFQIGMNRMAVFFRDITERKQVQEALVLSAKEWQTTFDSTNDAIWIIDKEQRILRSNKTAELIFHQPTSEFIGRHCWEIVHGTTHPIPECPVLRARKNMRRESMEFQIKEQWFEVTVDPILDAAGQYSGAVHIVSDVTKRRLAEDAMRESEKNYRELIDGMNETVWIIDLNGNLIDVNKTAVEVLGYSKEELLNIGLLGIDSSLKKEEIEALIKKLPSVKVQMFETSHTTKDGRTFPVEVYSSLVMYRGKETILSIARNITERKQIEDHLRHMQKMEGLGTLAGGIAHDFNNILGIILAYISSMERFKGDAKKLDLATETITKAVHRGKTLVQQILTFARKSTTAFGAVNVNDVVTEIMTMIMETFPKILTYAQNVDKAVTYINADRSQLHQALLNLCVNARDAMPGGGVLTITTRMVSSISLRNQYPDAAESSYVCIEVGDTGEGITPENQKRIFEPFFTTKEIGKGTGLGLAVVFGVVQTHKGFIDVESELGKGTIFRLYLPASQVAEPISEKDEETLEEISGGTETVLIVEDEEMLMMSLRMVLVEKGYNVLSAGDGLTALKIYQERKNDIALVLTDLGLPNMNGLEVCQRIKTIKPNERMILATGFLDPDMKSEFLKAGIQHFLYKPYDLKKVLKVIREVLDGK